MANGFKSGVYNIPANVAEFDVTGLALSFIPGSAQISVRQPATDADVVSAKISGSLTASGFHVILSSPVSTSGYLLDYVVFGGGDSPINPGDTLAVSYNDLKNKVAYFLGWNASSLTADQTARVDDCIQTGLRRFYYPPMMEGVDANFEWSFLRQSGTITTSANVDNYLLPDGFNRVLGQLRFNASEIGSAQPSVAITSYGTVMSMLQDYPRTGIPEIAAIISTNTYGEKGQKKRIYLWPTPAAAYTLTFDGDSDPGKLDATTHIFPMGGAMYSELIIESCLAAAEQSVNDEAGQHTAMFNSMLVSTIQRDRKNSAQVFGNIGDPHYRRYW